MLEKIYIYINLNIIDKNRSRAKQRDGFLNNLVTDSQSVTLYLSLS